MFIGLRFHRYFSPFRGCDDFVKYSREVFSHWGRYIDWLRSEMWGITPGNPKGRVSRHRRHRIVPDKLSNLDPFAQSCWRSET